MVITTRRALAQDLWSYGEDELSKRVLSVTEEQLHQIFERAGEYAATAEPESTSGRGMLLSKALALAAVEVLDGRTALKRKRRRAGFAASGPEVDPEVEMNELLDFLESEDRELRGTSGP